MYKFYTDAEWAEIDEFITNSECLKPEAEWVQFQEAVACEGEDA